MRPACLIPAGLLAASLLGACGRQERVIEITSAPPGAIVWLNDVELGRTPVQTEFLHFGTYDVRLRLEGHEPLVTSREAVTPVHELPPIDLVAAALPGVRRTFLQWHFDLTPLPELTDAASAERALLDRARTFRASAPAEPPPAPEPAATPAPTDAPKPAAGR
jgi:hypothetical protein